MASEFMGLALAEAERARGRTAPRPPVGAVVVRDGTVVGRGFTQPIGGAHAEVMALNQAGAAARGADLYVTLEPCCHHGRTPPCTDAVLAAGIAAVCVALPDPNPLVNGQGIAQLRQHGVLVTVGDGAEEARLALAPFFKHVQTGLPFVTAKWAMSLDGRIATSTGDSRWISGPTALSWAHELRDVVDAVVIGVGTAIADDPRLTVRLPRDERSVLRVPRPDRPLRVVLDSTCRLPLRSKLLSPELATGTLVVTTERAPREARAAIAASGGTVEMVQANAEGRVDPRAALEALGRRGLLHVLVEGGAAVHAAMLEAGLVDAVAVIVAPKVIGGAGALGPVGGSGVDRLAEALRLACVRVDRLGDDILINAVPAACSPQPDKAGEGGA